MTTKTQAEIRGEITAILDQAGINWDVAGTGILVSSFRAAGETQDRREVEAVLQGAEVPFEARRGGTYISAYDMEQLANKGWGGPR